MNIIPAFNQYPHCRMNINSVIILVGLSVRWRDQIINITLISYNLTHLTSPHQPGPLSLVQECRGLALIAPEMLLHQLSYAIKNQLVASKSPKPPIRGFGTQNIPIGWYFARTSLVLYGIRAPIIGPFRAWKPPIPWMRRAGSLWHKRPGAATSLDQ